MQTRPGEDEPTGQDPTQAEQEDANEKVQEDAAQQRESDRGYQ